MKKGIGATVISIVILAVVAVGLYFWAYYPREEDQQEGQQTEAAGADHSRQEEGTAQVPLEDDSQLPGENQDGQAEGGQLPEGAEDQQTDAAQSEETEPEEVTLVFTGDIFLSPYVLNNYDSAGIHGVVSDYLLEEMKTGDITVANEEFPFSTRGEQAPDKQFTFRVDPSYVTALTDMGIDLVTLANNHALDYGTQALTDTFDTLDAAGIAYIGAGADKERAEEPWIFQAGQKKFGFLGASRVIPEVSWNIENQQPGMLCTYDSKSLCEAIRTTKQQCDFVTVYVHWGIERENMPQEYQRQLAKEYIDAGADLVIGAHPHVLQGIEYYNGKPIVYSLGNYIFNQEIASTVLLKAVVTPENEITLQLLPAFSSGAKTQEMSEEKAAELYRFMEEISYEVTIGADGVVQVK